MSRSFQAPLGVGVDFRLRLGNCTTDEVAGLLRRHAIDIEQFGGQVEITVLELG